MEIRAAVPADAEGMSRVLNEIGAARGRERPIDPAFVLARYLGHPDRVACSVAVDGDGRILGFQSLKRASAANPYGVPVGWGIVGTHVSPGAARRGIGAKLLVATLDAARRARLPGIDATIGADNSAALSFYGALGFRTYRAAGGSICKVFEVR